MEILRIYAYDSHWSFIGEGFTFHAFHNSNAEKERSKLGDRFMAVLCSMRSLFSGQQVCPLSFSAQNPENWRNSMKRLSVFVFIISIPMWSLAQAPTGYYNSASGLTGQQLLDALHQIIDDHVRFPYTSTSTDTWDILSDADEDGGNANNVLTIYKNASVGKTTHPDSWNREHSWPKSLGFPTDGSCNYPYTDAHHLFAANPSYNSTRSNRPYGNCGGGCSTLTVDGSSLLNYYTGAYAAGTFEPWDSVKGDLARVMFYMAVRYEGGTHGVTGCTEPDLKLTDDRALIISYSSNQSEAYMGLLSDLLAWHAADPVDAFEEYRNDVVFSYQGNRNPFVDHPEYIDAIINNGGTFGGTPTGGGGDPGGGGGGGGNPGTVGDVWINEFHYDNASTDTGEGVEIAGVAGVSLSGFQLVGYNGNGGSSYKTVNLSGTLPDDGSGFGQIWFDFTSMQNGAPDGLALVDNTGAVLQFISYEGTMTAAGGPANGMVSEDVGVTESSSTPVGYSLQLGGSGSTAADFVWELAAAQTPNAANNNQTFAGGSGGGGGTTPPSGSVDPWINEFHYDDSGSDQNEGIEVAGEAGTDLAGWTLVGYNGNNGSVYKTVTLSGTLPNTQNGFGQIWFSFSGLQNGAPDGMALVDANGAVVLFLSYEGSFTANGGPADGMTSTNVGVSESSGSSSSQSLQLTGSGGQYSDFTWSGAQAHTRDGMNNGQNYQ